MTGIVDFRSMIAELERLQFDLAAASTSSEGQWRKDLIQLRRQFQAHITTLAQELERMANSPRPEDMLPKVRDALSRMRTGTALHQATWPAVSADRNDDGYNRSLADVQATGKTFVTLAKDMIQRGQH